MKKSYLLILVLFLWSSCGLIAPNMNLNANISLYVVDSLGNDLLDPENPDSYTEDDISIYYLIDGKKELAINWKMKNSKQFFISDETRNDKHFMIVYVNHNHVNKEEYPVTYIHWDKDGNDIDTLRFHFLYYSGNITWNKVWINDVEYPSNSSGFHEIVK